MKTELRKTGDKLTSLLKSATVVSVSVIMIAFGQGDLWASGNSTEKGYPYGPGNYERTIRVGGIERRYLVHVPPTYEKDKPIPLILNFHGGGGSPETQRNISVMDADSDRFGFIVVYPEGTNEENRFRLRKGYTWNAGNCCGWAQEHQIDDLSFTTAMLDKLEAQFNIDSKRIYATGFSNGAMMCYRLACELSNRIAAIATVGAPMGMSKCQPSRAVSVMHFHGTKDESAPYAGGTGRLSFPGQNFMPVEETIRFWLKALNLEQGKSRVTRIGAAVMETWGPAKEGAEVILWKLEGGGHTWPGGKFGLLGEKVLGKMNMDISANHEMWRFFQRHPMP